jgi:misacylated tRNA(Ala) deacylase
MTVELFREDAYLRRCDAVVIAAGAEGIVLDRTVFYAEGGGQPGDRGVLETATGPIAIRDTKKAADGTLLHLPADPALLPALGAQVSAVIDWDYRYRHMRTHTCLHLLCSIVPYPVTGGSVGQEKGRLDFDTAEPLDGAQLEAELARLVAADLPVACRWITDEEMAANMELVRTMSVKPPMGSGRVRLVEIAETDLQPCGGTHLARTGEVGGLRIGKIESKGKHNRRVNVHLL